ncbi:MAG: ABC transporter substrate-binding protein [Acutalibacteraceae bacterium]
MKHTIKKLLAVVLCLCFVFAFASCTGSNSGDTTATTAASADSETLKIGIIQYVSHPSLDNCYTGIKNALDESGLDIQIDRQIGSDNAADSDCSSYAKNMVAQKYDMIFAIATPAATAAYAATEGTDIPVIFCAVSDPVAAKLVDSNDAPGGLCSGTSDVLDLDAQVDMIQAMQPDVKSIGILYTTSEPNSITQLSLLKEICDKCGITVEATGIQNDSDIPSAATALASKVDCINNFTDNKVVNNLSVVLEAASDAGIPVYGSEVEQVKNGCLAAVSIDYVALGEVTGQMGIDVLGGADISTMAVKTISDATPVVNTDVLSALNMEMPAAYSDAETVQTNTEETTAAE